MSQAFSWHITVCSGITTSTPALDIHMFLRHLSVKDWHCRWFFLPRLWWSWVWNRSVSLHVITKDHGLILNTEKCEVKQPAINFFGCMYVTYGCHPYQATATTINNMSCPVNVTKLQALPLIVTYQVQCLYTISVDTYCTTAWGTACKCQLYMKQHLPGCAPLCERAYLSDVTLC